MGLAANYAGRVGLAAWRRKSALLGATGILMLLLVALQYHQAAGPAPPAAVPLPAAQAQDQESDIEDDSRRNVLRDDIGSDSVKFLQSGSKKDINPDEGNKVVADQENVVVHLPVDQPSRDEIAIRQESIQRYNAGGGGIADDGRNRGAIYSGGVVAEQQRQPYVPPQRLAHFDLKGAPPKLTFLKKVFGILEKTGTTGVLMEWEDMFPFWGKLSGIAASNAYSRQDVQTILEMAKEHNLEVIPLVQTFGHVEFALKHEQWSSLREVPDSPQALCPSLNSSMEFIETMIEQVMELHPGVRYLHIGCDEVFQMGECSRCRSVQRDKLFLSHVASIAKFVRRKYTHPATNQPVIPIIWHDMLLHFSSQTMEEYKIGELVEPMVWVYAEDVYRFVPTTVWDKFAVVFPKVWAASAFKGAFGETLYIPNIKRHLENNLRWLEVMAVEGPKFKGGFQGIAVTGWQRYDHFAVLCELLPAAVPSLVINMLTVSHGFMNASLRNKMNQVLGCLNSGNGGSGNSASTTRYGTMNALHFLNLNSDPFLWDMFSRCFFPGMPFYKLTYRLNSAEREVEEFLDSVTKVKGWMTEYNVRRNFTSPLRVDELMMEHSRVYHSMASLARAANEALSDVFDSYTIAEWVEQRIYPDVVRLERVQNYALQLKSRRVWPRRPLPPLIDLKRLGVVMPGEEDSSSTPKPVANVIGP